MHLFVVRIAISSGTTSRYHAVGQLKGPAKQISPVPPRLMRGRYDLMAEMAREGRGRVGSLAEPNQQRRGCCLMQYILYHQLTTVTTTTTTIIIIVIITIAFI